MHIAGVKIRGPLGLGFGMWEGLEKSCRGEGWKEGFDLVCDVTFPTSAERVKR